MNEFKKLAAEKATDYVKSGMVLGLGTGSTTFYALQKIGEMIKTGELTNVSGVPSSKQTEEVAKDFGIPLTTINENPVLDLAIDGADEVDQHLNLIKGGGGALLREKVLAQATKKFIVVGDDTKTSKCLGEKWHVPVEVLKFAAASEKLYIESLDAEVKIREKNGEQFITDEGNIILDCNFGIIEDPAALALRLERRAGIVEHGLFIDLSDIVIIAGERGIIVHNK